MRFFKLSSLVFLVTALIACETTPNGPITPVEVEGFKPFPSVRTFDKSGRIFRIDPEGNYWKVALLEVNPQVGDEILPKVMAKTEISLEQVLETIGVAAAEVPANLHANITKSREFVTESVNGQREFLDDSQVDPLLSEAFKDIIVRKNNRYYLIRETILSEQLNYRSSKSWLVDAGVEAEFKEVVKGKADLNWGDQEEFSLNKNFDQPLRIWYKAERIEVERPLGIGPGQPVKMKTIQVNPDEFTIPRDVPVNP